MARPPRLLPNHRTVDRSRPHESPGQPDREHHPRAGDYLHHPACRLRAGLAQFPHRPGGPARRYQAGRHLLRCPGVGQPAADAPHGHHQRDARLLDHHQHRDAERRAQLGLLRRAGAVGAAQVAAHHDLLDALHLAGSGRSAGGPGSALWHGVRRRSDAGGRVVRCAERQQPSTLVPAAERIAGGARGTRRCIAGRSRRHLHRPALLLHALPAAPAAAQGVDRRAGVRGHHHWLLPPLAPPRHGWIIR